jgi:hypothetical protein
MRRYRPASCITLPLAVIRLGGTSGFWQVHRLQSRYMPRSVKEMSRRFRLTYSFLGKRSIWITEKESYSETAKVIISWQTKGSLKRRKSLLRTEKCEALSWKWRQQIYSKLRKCYMKIVAIGAADYFLTLEVLREYGSSIFSRNVD